MKIQKRLHEGMPSSLSQPGMDAAMAASKHALATIVSSSKDNNDQSSLTNTMGTVPAVAPILPGHGIENISYTGNGYALPSLRVFNPEGATTDTTSVWEEGRLTGNGGLGRGCQTDIRIGI